MKNALMQEMQLPIIQETVSFSYHNTIGVILFTSKGFLHVNNHHQMILLNMKIMFT